MAVMSQGQSGFSLIELMIATTILSLVMFTGYYSYSLYSNSWEKRSEHYWNEVNTSIGIDSLIRSLESANAYVVRNAEDRESVLFEGDENKLTFVSNSPLFSKYTALVQFELVESDNSYALIYSERPLQNTALYSWPSNKVQWQNRVVLLEGIESYQFSYFAYDSFSDALESGNSSDIMFFEQAPSKRWQSAISMKVHRFLPHKVNLEYTSIEQKQTYITIDLPQNTASHVVWMMRQDF